MQKRLEIYGFCNKGYEGQAIRIQCDIRNGFPSFDIIGLADKAISESKERVRSALRNTGFKFPQQHVLVSLSPAGIPKSGSLLDLGIALSILFCQKDDGGPVRKIMTAGELALDGTVLEDPSATGAINWARKLGCSLCVIPCDAPNCIKAESLPKVFLSCGEFYNNNDDAVLPQISQNPAPVFEDVIGLADEKEIIAIAASGFHSTLLFGPPGVGKTMLSRKLNLLIPELDNVEQIELTHIYGCAGQSIEDPAKPVLINVPHDCSPSQFVGGLNSKAPGLGALSHRGVLLLDEITKFTPSLRESIKDSYDRGTTTSSKSGETVSYPARFLMAGNLNPCPCGGLGSESKSCRCTSNQIASHWNKLTNPLIERFDIRLPLEEKNISDLINQSKKSDAYYIDNICEAYDRQKSRYRNFEITFNGQIHFIPKVLSVFSREIERLEKIIKDPNQIRNTRNLIGILSLSRTIADYNRRDVVSDDDFLFALSLRQYGIGDYYWKVIY